LTIPNAIVSHSTFTDIPVNYYFFPRLAEFFPVIYRFDTMPDWCYHDGDGQNRLNCVDV